jgi:hypothetical protein
MAPRFKVLNLITLMDVIYLGAVKILRLSLKFKGIENIFKCGFC